MNLLLFIYEIDFDTHLHIIANNELDLEEHLRKDYNYRAIVFEDLTKSYGVCRFTDEAGNKEVTKCFYIKKI